MSKLPNERKDERIETGQSWDNEGGGQSPNVPPQKEQDNDRGSQRTKKRGSRPASPATVPDTLFSSTYFVKLWNAGSRTVNARRLPGRRALLSINPADLENRTVFQRNYVLTVARHRDRWAFGEVIFIN